MGTVSGAVHMRPSRFGLVAKTLTAELILRGAAMATSVWGGLYFPMLGIDDPELTVAADALALDCLYPLDDAPETIEVCETAGLRWQGRPPYGPFDPERENFTTGLLAAYKQFREAPRVLPEWHPADPLATLLGVFYGIFLPGEDGAVTREAFRKGALLVPVANGDNMPDLAGQLAPIESTGAGLSYTGDGPRAAVVLIGDDPADLALLWNARAMGAHVFPWPTAHTDRCEEALRAWAVSSTVETHASYWRSGDGMTSGRSVSVLSNSEPHPSVIEQLARLVERPGWILRPDALYPAAGWMGHHPVQTELERSFSVVADRDDWQITLPLPELHLGASERRTIVPGYVVADVVVHREQDLSPGRSFCIPALRRLAPLLSELRDETGPLSRPTGEGRTVAVQASKESLTLGLMPTLPLMTEVFEGTGWTLAQSDEGRFGTQLVERLGGLRAQTSSQPAVREVLHLASRATRAHPISRFIECAKNSRGAWPDDLFSRTSPDDYAKGVVYWLVRRGLLRAALPVRCPACATDTDLRPEDLTSDLRCPFCESAFPLGYALAVAPGRSGEWKYQLSASIPPDRLRSALPVMAALSIAMSARAGTLPSLPHVLGLEVHGDDWRCELDIAALIMEGPQTTFLIAEVKGGGDAIDARDLHNLERVRDGLNSVGVDAVIMVATGRNAFNEAEEVLLQEMSNRAPERLSGRGPSTLNFPIALVGKDISVPWGNHDHPWRWGGPGDLPLAGLAQESCKRNLRLASVDTEWNGSAFQMRPRWTDPNQK